MMITITVNQMDTGRTNVKITVQRPGKLLTERAISIHFLRHESARGLEWIIHETLSWVPELEDTFQSGFSLDKSPRAK